MNVNITLCVQCLNFFITYLFLRYALFKPVIKIILNEESQNAQIQYEIAQQQACIAEQFHLRQLHWQEFETHCQFNKPELEDVIDITQDATLALPKMSINTTYIESMSTECATLIVGHLKQRILHHD